MRYWKILAFARTRKRAASIFVEKQHQIDEEDISAGNFIVKIILQLENQVVSERPSLFISYLKAPGSKRKAS